MFRIRAGNLQPMSQIQAAAGPTWSHPFAYVLFVVLLNLIGKVVSYSRDHMMYKAKHIYYEIVYRKTFLCNWYSGHISLKNKQNLRI